MWKVAEETTPEVRGAAAALAAAAGGYFA